MGNAHVVDSSFIIDEMHQHLDHGFLLFDWLAAKQQKDESLHSQPPVQWHIFLDSYLFIEPARAIKMCSHPEKILRSRFIIIFKPSA
jgi:hypothetical protein